MHPPRDGDGGQGNLLPGKTEGDPAKSPGADNSGKVKIPANPLLFGQRKAKQWLWLISPEIG